MVILDQSKDFGELGCTTRVAAYSPTSSASAAAIARRSRSSGVVGVALARSAPAGSRVQAAATSAVPPSIIDRRDTLVSGVTSEPGTRPR